jgi:uncharacterized protein
MIKNLPRVCFRATKELWPRYTLHPSKFSPERQNNMAGKFELKKSKNDKFYFSLLAGNGQIILGSEMYESKASAQNGIASVQKNASMEERYERMNSTKGDPYFVLKAGNHQVIGKSQMYASEKARDNGIESCKTNGPSSATDDQT